MSAANLTEHQIDCMQRIGRDEVARSITTGLTEHDALCKTARSFHGACRLLEEVLEFLSDEQWSGARGYSIAVRTKDFLDSNYAKEPTP